MRKTIFIVLSLSYLFGLDVYSGGELSDNQKAIDVTHYDINLKVDPKRKVILGKVEITFFEFFLYKQLSIIPLSAKGKRLNKNRPGRRPLPVEPMAPPLAK